MLKKDITKFKRINPNNCEIGSTITRLENKFFGLKKNYYLSLIIKNDKTNKNEFLNIKKIDINEDNWNEFNFFHICYIPITLEKHKDLLINSIKNKSKFKIEKNFLIYFNKNKLRKELNFLKYDEYLILTIIGINKYSYQNLHISKLVFNVFTNQEFEIDFNENNNSGWNKFNLNVNKKLINDII